MTTDLQYSSVFWKDNMVF